MKLIKSKERAAQYGLPASRSEWWDIDDGYEIYVNISDNLCTVGVREPQKNITYEIARSLDLDTSEEFLIKKYTGDAELYVQLGIDCVSLIYKKPEKYKELLELIEKIVNHKFKNKT